MGIDDAMNNAKVPDNSEEEMKTKAKETEQQPAPSTSHAPAMPHKTKEPTRSAKCCSERFYSLFTKELDNATMMKNLSSWYYDELLKQGCAEEYMNARNNRQRNKKSSN